MEVCRFGVILLLVLCVTLPAEAQPPDVAQRYSNFLTRHVYNHKAPVKCTSEISKREITADPNTNECKDVNTFILANAQQVRAVCDSLTGVFTSGQSFKVVTCKLKSGERWPKCEYTGHKSDRYITISCDRGWPVHYQDDTIVG